MSKKLFALLAALSAVGFYGCDSDDSGCTDGEKRCGSASIEICSNGEWRETQKCAAGCEEKSGVPTCKTSGGNEGGTQGGNEGGTQGGNEGGTQGGNEGGTQGGSTDPSVGSTCDATTFTPKCINNNANALVCKNGTVQQWTCANSACTVSGSDVNCPKADSGTTTCTNPVTTGGNVGDCCDKNTYQQTCINGNGNALICWNDKVTQWDCADNECAPDQTQPLKVVCKKGSTGGGTTTDLPACAKVDAGAECAACTPVCDGGTAYLCDTTKNKSMKWTCDKTCSVTGLSVTCEKNCTGQTLLESGGNSGDCCDTKKYLPVCKGDKVDRCTSKGLVVIDQDCKSCTLVDNPTKDSGKEFICK